MNWLREAITDGQTGKASAKRIAMLTATWALAITTLILGAATLIGYEVAASLGAVALPLAGLGGYSYVGGKTAELKRTGDEK